MKFYKVLTIFLVLMFTASAASATCWNHGNDHYKHAYGHHKYDYGHQHKWTCTDCNGCEKCICDSNGCVCVGCDQVATEDNEEDNVTTDSSTCPTCNQEVTV